MQPRSAWKQTADAVRRILARGLERRVPAEPVQQLQRVRFASYLKDHPLDLIYFSWKVFDCKVSTLALSPMKRLCPS